MLTTVLLLSSVALLASRRAPRIARDEVAQVWIGLMENEAYVVRLDLDRNGTGRGAYVFVDAKPVTFAISAWRYDPAVGADIEIVVAAESKESEIRLLRGRVLGRTLEMEVSGKSWHRPASFRPEAPLERRWKAVQSAMAPAGGAAEN